MKKLMRSPNDNDRNGFAQATAYLEGLGDEMTASGSDPKKKKDVLFAKCNKAWWSFVGLEKTISVLSKSFSFDEEIRLEERLIRLKIRFNDVKTSIKFMEDGRSLEVLESGLRLALIEAEIFTLGFTLKQDDRERVVVSSSKQSWEPHHRRE